MDIDPGVIFPILGLLVVFTILGKLFKIIWEEVFPFQDPRIKKEKAAQKAKEARETAAQEAQEVKLQEVMTTIERLNPKWLVSPNTIGFVKETEDGIYSGSMGYKDEFSTGWDSEYSYLNTPGSSYIYITLSNGLEVINIFNESWNYPYLKIKNYIVNHSSYKEHISRQELEIAQVLDTEQKKKEAEEEVKDRLLDRFLSRT